jgi:hypothetical protein
VGDIRYSKEIDFYDDKENLCPPPMNITGVARSKKKSVAPFAPAAKLHVAPVVIVKLASWYVAPVTPAAKKYVDPAVFVKSTSLFALSGTAGCKCTGYQDPRGGDIYKL